MVYKTYKNLEDKYGEKLWLDELKKNYKNKKFNFRF
jgi:hypothetical protein